MASSLSVGGLGSGIDVSGIVSQLMEIERQPLKALDTKEASVQARISAFGSIKSSLSTLQNAIAGLKLPAGGNALDFYSTYSGTLSDDGVASVTATADDDHVVFHGFARAVLGKDFFVGHVLLVRYWMKGVILYEQGARAMSDGRLIVSSG